jgi:predicted SAM-dependent methyltransferase
MTVRIALGSLARRLRSVQVRIKALAAARRLSGQTRLHLGCGANVLSAWANVDLARREGVVRWDLTDPLPVQSDTIAFVYCEHFLEHISLDDARGLLSECRRVLKGGGVLRLSTPSLSKLVEDYRLGRTSEWRDVGWNPATPCQMVNEGLRLWGHEFVYDEAELRQILQEVGFRVVRRVGWRHSEHAELRGLESRPDHHEIILESVK